jgi:hypothetical protein
MEYHAMRLYHVTPCHNTCDIRRFGIDPSYSKRKILNTYLVTIGNITWAINHTAKRHKVYTRHVRIFEVIVRPAQVKHAGHGIYTTTELLTPIQDYAYNG